MTDINGNFNNYEPKNDFKKNINKIIPEEKVTDEQDKKSGDAKAYDNLPAADVLGRSQVASPKGSNPAKSVDEALTITSKFSPEILEASDRVFDTVYYEAKESGDDDETAYAKAAMASDEFWELVAARAQQ